MPRGRLPETPSPANHLANQLTWILAAQGAHLRDSPWTQFISDWDTFSRNNSIDGAFSCTFI